MSDIVERMTEQADIVADLPEPPPGVANSMREAASEIEALRERVREAEGRVAEAVAAERARAVMIAHRWGKQARRDMEALGEPDDWKAGAYEAAFQIASAIERGE